MLRTALLGDCGRVARDPLDLLRPTFLVGAVAFAVADELSGSELQRGDRDTVGDLMADGAGRLARP